MSGIQWEDHERPVIECLLDGPILGLRLVNFKPLQERQTDRPRERDPRRREREVVRKNLIFKIFKQWKQSTKCQHSSSLVHSSFNFTKYLGSTSYDSRQFGCSSEREPYTLAWVSVSYCSLCYHMASQIAISSTMLFTQNVTCGPMSIIINNQEKKIGNVMKTMRDTRKSVLYSSELGLSMVKLIHSNKNLFYLAR